MLESLFNKVAGLQMCNFIKKSLHHEFFCEYCKIFKNIYFEEHLIKAASVTTIDIQSWLQLLIIEMMLAMQNVTF